MVPNQEDFDLQQPLAELLRHFDWFIWEQVLWASSK